MQDNISLCLCLDFSYGINQKLLIIIDMVAGVRTRNFLIVRVLSLPPDQHSRHGQ